jgi:hypothetical protein
MQKIFKRIILGTVFAALLVMTACGTGETGEPTPDINAIRTEAVKTAMVEMTVQAALSPTETAPPPTMTPLPTATLNTGAAQPATGSSSSSASSSSGSSGAVVTAGPTATPDIYICEFVDQSPLDGPQMTGWIYDVVWTFRNVGTAKWTKADYYIMWAGGDDLSPTHIYKLSKDVGYYETVDIGVDITIPPSPVGVPGYITKWALVNNNGEQICNFYHQITLTYPPPTATP